MSPPSERRAFERTATTLRGKAFPGGVDCVIRDMNRRGARLGFPAEPPAVAPSVVVIWSTGFAFDIAKRWGAGDEIGVLFSRRCDLRGKVPLHMAEIKSQWLGRRRQLHRNEIRACDAVIGDRAPPRVVRIS